MPCMFPEVWASVTEVYPTLEVQRGEKGKQSQARTLSRLSEVIMLRSLYCLRRFWTCPPSQLFELLTYSLKYFAVPGYCNPEPCVASTPPPFYRVWALRADLSLATTRHPSIRTLLRTCEFGNTTLTDLCLHLTKQKCPSHR